MYYTRIATPLSLHESAYPSEFKFSLFTREHKTAYRRNIEKIQLLHGLFDQAIASNQLFGDFKALLASAINALRLKYRRPL